MNVYPFQGRRLSSKSPHRELFSRVQFVEAAQSRPQNAGPLGQAHPHFEIFTMAAAAAAAPPLDPKDHKAFMELQEKMIDSHQSLKGIAASMRCA